MVDVEFGDERTPESVLCRIEDIGTSTIIQDGAPKGGVQRRCPQFYDRQQQLELVLEAQRLLEVEVQGVFSGSGDEKGEFETGHSNNDIWEDNNSMELLRTGSLPDSIDPAESK